MKNFIWLSLITILVFSSCKTNSFYSRHYTHFNNKQKHTNVKEPLAANKAKTLPNPPLVVSTHITKEESSEPGQPAVLYANAKPAHKNAASKSIFRFQSLPAHVANTISAKVGDLNAEKSANQDKSPAQSAHLLGELLSLILYILVICILVLLVIFLLAVV